MKNICVIGANGMLGFAVTSYFGKQSYKVVRVTRDEFNITHDNIVALEELLQRNDIEYIINCAGVIKPRIACMSIEDVLKVNAIFPRNLSNIAKRNRMRLIHITTDCVYSGRTGDYNESDYFDGEDIYGISKNAGEIKSCMTIRTSIIGEEKRQGRSLLEWVRSQRGKEVNGFENHKWNGVTTIYLSEIIHKIIQQDLFSEGIFHIHSIDTVNKFELLKLINDVYDLGITIHKVEADSACNRSMSSIFPLTSKLSNKSLKTQLNEMREFFSIDNY